MTAAFARDYAGLLALAEAHGTVEENVRTKRRVRTLYGVSMTVDLTEGLPVIDLRRTYPRTAAVELAWFLSGSSNVKWLHQFDCHIWDKFASSDGEVLSYGQRWRAHFGRDQVQAALDELASDGSSRQVVVCAWDPQVDGMHHASGLVGPRPKNVPCPTHFTLNLAPDGRLFSSYFLRSSDLYVGLPYDVMNHALLVAALAHELTERRGQRVTPAALLVVMAHAHVYEVHLPLLSEAWAKMSARKPQVPPEQVLPPGYRVQDIVARPADFVNSLPLHAGPALVQRPELVA